LRCLGLATQIPVLVRRRQKASVFLFRQRDEHVHHPAFRGPCFLSEQASITLSPKSGVLKVSRVRVFTMLFTVLVTIAEWCESGSASRRPSAAFRRTGVEGLGGPVSSFRHHTIRWAKRYPDLTRSTRTHLGTHSHRLALDCHCIPHHLESDVSTLDCE